MPGVVQLPSPEDSYEHFDEGVGGQLLAAAQQHLNEEPRRQVQTESPEHAARRQLRS
jgi:hypothetical protein